MIQITGNKAAWIPFEKAKDLEVGPGPKPNPTENEVVIKVAFAAVNPTDWKVSTELHPSQNDTESNPTTRTKIVHISNSSTPPFSGLTFQAPLSNSDHPSLASRLARESLLIVIVFTPRKLPTLDFRDMPPLARSSSLLSPNLYLWGVLLFFR